MPPTVNQLRIKDLPAITQQADLLDKNFEVENPAGSGTDKNYQVSFPTVIQAVANNLPAPTKLTHIIVDTYDQNDPAYTPGEPTLVSLSNSLDLVMWMTAYVQFPNNPSKQYRLVYDPNGPYQAYRDITFTNTKNPCKWVEIGSADDLTSGIADFNPFQAKYETGDTVKFTVGGRLRIFAAKSDLVKGTFSTNRVPEPTGLSTDPSWAEVNPYIEGVPNQSRLGQLACRYYTNAERAADPYPIGDTVEDLTARENAGADILYANRTVTVELGPHTGTYRVVYEPTSPEFHAYVDGSFTSGKNPCKWELVPTGGNTAGSASGNFIKAISETTATAAGSQIITLASAATGILSVYVMEPTGYVRLVYPTSYSVSGTTLTITANANIQAGDKIAGHYYTGSTSPSVAAVPFYELIGQSNADGQARTSELPSSYTGVLPNSFIYTPFTAAFAPLQGGVNSGTTGGDNWGLEISLLPALATSLGTRVNLAKYAVPGTQLAASGGQDWAPTATGEYYDLSNANTTAARAALATHPAPAAIIWSQGESDANPTYAAAYEANLTAFIAAKRSYLGFQVPFVIVQLSTNQTFLDAASLATVRTAQASVASNVAGCYLVPTDDLPLDGQHLHYTAAGLITLGQRVAAVLQNPTGTVATQAPLVTGDDLANTITVTHRYGVAGTEAQVASSGTWIPYTAVAGYDAASGKIVVGDVDRPAGYFLFRTAADPASGRTASASVAAPAFTKAATAPGGPNLLTVSDLSDPAWNPADVQVLGGQPDAAGGTTATLARPTAATNNSHSLHYNSLTLPANNYAFTVEGLPAGYQHIEFVLLDASNFQEVVKVVFDLQAGTQVSATGGSGTVSALAGGWFRTRVAFTSPGGSFYPFVKVLDGPVDAVFTGNGSGVYLANPVLQ